jgi:hypothetical protein
MYKEPSEAIAQIVDGLTRNIVELHARCDALAALVLAMGRELGGDADKLNAVLETVRATSVQKYLEKIEARDPKMSAILDERFDLATVDWDLLKNLRFRS